MTQHSVVRLGTEFYEYDGAGNIWRIGNDRYLPHQAPSQIPTTPASTAAMEKDPVRHSSAMRCPIRTVVRRKTWSPTTNSCPTSLQRRNVETMYGLPKDFSADFLIGKQLQQVSFSINTVHLVFDGDFSITVESSFLHKDLDNLQNLSTIPVERSSLMQLVGRTVTKIGVSDSGTLTIYFDDGQVFSCFDDSENYESYRINSALGEVIV